MKSIPLLGLGALALTLAPALHAGPEDAKALAGTIDKRVASAWGKGVTPAPLADDAEFFRRINLDLAGRIPSITEIRDFLDDDRPDKRRLWVERILRSDADDASYHDAYVNHFANIWRAWRMCVPAGRARLCCVAAPR